ncbi:hypothetical protein SNE40_001634 [Patella caerulea]|uniref:Serpin domain-containing protein n=2 Tax=Patella caerulea TaxID=87958 RepID=A0AAN8KI21_PATCE
MANLSRVFILILLVAGCCDVAESGRRIRNRPGGQRQTNRAMQSSRRAGSRQNPLFLLRKISEASGKFSVDMYNRLRPQNPNLIFSPVSIFIALSMTSLGARGPSKFQINRTLRQFAMRRFSHQASRILLSKLPNSNDNITFQYANGIFLRPETTVLPSFKGRIRRFYNTEVFNLSSWYPERDINNWVERKTNGLLSDFLSPGSIGDSFMMWIINAVFFRGTWEKLFDLRKTSRRPFTGTGGNAAYVEMMEMVDSFPSNRIEALQTSVLELPYVGGRYSLFIFLPDRSNGLENLETNMTYRTLETIMKNMEDPKVFSIGIPKIYLDNSLDLETSLKQMGITRIFDVREADLSGIEGDNTLFVDSIIHKSVLEVNEFGTIATTVTQVAIATKSLSQQFIANRPFMFIVRDKKYDINLFMGRFSYP